MTKLVRGKDPGLPVEDLCYSGMVCGPAGLALLGSLLEIQSWTPFQTLLESVLTRSLGGTRALLSSLIGSRNT